MSFKLFIYYCALCGGWGAFLAWAALWAAGILGIDQPFLKTPLIAGCLGLLVAAAVGGVDAVLNAVGSQRFVRVGICMAVGLVGGAVGGLVGEALHQMVLLVLHAAAGDMLDSIGGFLLLFGWILVGVAIGAAIGVFDLMRAMTGKQDMRVALRKTLNGVYGGLLGGLIGGVFFGLLYALKGTRELFPNAILTIGLVILGLCIGLLIGLAQVVLKEAWLKIESGRRAGREVMLSKNETTIGRAESCDIGLFGDNAIERQHARIQLKDNQYLLADLETPGGTYLNDKPVRKPMPLRNGDAIRVGNSVLRFGERQKRG
jgi:Inner membrane component of T3SS, cytoplasmic domain